MTPGTLLDSFALLWSFGCLQMDGDSNSKSAQNTKTLPVTNATGWLMIATVGDCASQPYCQSTNGSSSQKYGSTGGGFVFRRGTSPRRSRNHFRREHDPIDPFNHIRLGMIYISISIINPLGVKSPTASVHPHRVLLSSGRRVTPLGPANQNGRRTTWTAMNGHPIVRRHTIICHSQYQSWLWMIIYHEHHNNNQNDFQPLPE
jgi:hypothetical protein